MVRGRRLTGGLLGGLLLFPTLLLAQKTNFRVGPQWGVYGGWNTNENYEFGLCIPLRNDAKFIPRKQTVTRDLPVTNFELSSAGFSSLSTRNVERYYIPTPYPVRVSLQFGLEKAAASQVYRPSFGATITPFSLLGVMPIRNKPRFYMRYFVNHVLLDASYLPLVNSYNDTWKVGGGAMWRIPFRHLAYGKHISFRLMVNYHYRIEENNGFRHDEFTFTLNLSLREHQLKNGYRILQAF